MSDLADPCVVVFFFSGGGGEDVVDAKTLAIN